MSEHLDKAVKAAAEAAFVPPISDDRIADMETALQAAEPHLERMCLEAIDHRLDERGMEAVEIGTREALEALTVACPDCEGDDSGGGVDEPPSAVSVCERCNHFGRVPKPDFERFKEAVLSKEAISAAIDAADISRRVGREVDPDPSIAAIDAALSKAQELMEEGG